MTDAASPHRTVLLAATVTLLAPRDGATYVDGTFGGGGLAAAILAAASCRVIGIDRDPSAIGGGADLAGRYPDRLTLVEGRFGGMAALLDAHGVEAVDGVALDLGVSSMQLDRPERGFSFRFDGPLDMRMGKDGTSAEELVNTLPERDLADIIQRLGEERHARRVARAIVAARPLRRTAELAALVRKVVPKQGGIDAATRTFQALRMEVNDELGELDRALLAAERLLAPGGRLVVIAFHSLEDRLVKHFLGARSSPPAVSRHRPAAAHSAPSFRLLTRRPVRPGADELLRNPRARSAKLRAAERTAAPAWREAA
jgi:16S rRNA (cytosine1402-N4)-methyltransferase